MSQLAGINRQSLEELDRVIHQGGLAVIPTDTVYGIVCDPCNDDAIEALFAAKQRPRSKSLQLLLPSLSALDQLGLDLPHPLDLLATRLLPGAFSPVCLARPDCQLKTLRQEGPIRTQAVRLPDSQACRSIVSRTGPLAASSANISGQDSPQSAQAAREQLGDAVALYLDAGPTPGPIPSTVVEADPSHKGGYRILRAGALPSDAIEQALPTRGSHQ